MKHEDHKDIQHTTSTKIPKGEKETMSMVVDIHKKNGMHPKFDIYIGRRIQYHPVFLKDSKWANRSRSLQTYEAHVRRDLWNDLDELEGKVLGCWCITTNNITPLRCHGQILMLLLQEKQAVNKS